MPGLPEGDGDFVVPEPMGHAVEARVYAEDPIRDFQPSAGVLTGVRFPPGVRVDTWIEPGTEVSPHYDPMLAKVIAHDVSRDEAWRRLGEALTESRVDGIETNLGLLRASCADDTVLAAEHSTATLASVHDREPRIEV